MLFIFFFQAEDGIRDIGVTGVQTCALPICGILGLLKWVGLGIGTIVFLFLMVRQLRKRESDELAGEPVWLREIQMPHTLARSEERRVGKECRSRWSPYH